MPTVDYMTIEVMKQCIEPVSEQIAKRLIFLLGFAEALSLNLYLTSDDLAASNFEDTNHKKKIHPNRCDVEIDTGYNPLGTVFDVVRGRSINSQLYSKTSTFSDYPIFNDARSGIRLYEITTPCSVELKFSIKVDSIELAEMLAARLYARALTGGSVYEYNDIQFSYALPYRLITFMRSMYDLQLDVKAAMPFEQYLSIGSNGMIGQLVNRDRQQDPGELIVQRINTEVLGKLEYAGDKPGKDSYNKVVDRYECAFSYFFQFSKPASLRLVHPVMVYNQQVEGQFVGKPQNMSIGTVKKYHPDQAINKYLLGNQVGSLNLSRSYPLVRHPYYDDWQRSPTMYTELHNDYQPIFIGLLTVTTDTATGEPVSLSVDIANEVFPMLMSGMPEAIVSVLRMMNLDPKAHLTYGDMFRRLGIFDIAIFANNNMVVHTNLALSSELVLTVDEPLELSKQYRVVISQIHNIKILNREYIYYMLDNPDYFVDFLAANISYLVDNRYVRIISDKLAHTKQVVTPVVDPPPTTGLTRPSITIHNYVVESRRNRY